MKLGPSLFRVFVKYVKGGHIKNKWNYNDLGDTNKKQRSKMEDTNYPNLQEHVYKSLNKTCYVD